MILDGTYPAAGSWLIAPRYLQTTVLGLSHASGADPGTGEVFFASESFLKGNVWRLSPPT